MGFKNKVYVKIKKKKRQKTPKGRIEAPETNQDRGKTERERDKRLLFEKQKEKIIQPEKIVKIVENYINRKNMH